MLPLSRNARFLLSTLLLLGIVLVLGLGILLSSLPQRHRPVADFLPANETVALFHGLTTESSRNLGRHFPILKQLPATTEPFDVAVLRLPNGSFGWALFTEGSKRPGGTTVDRFSVETSSAEADALLSPVDAALSDAPSFASLAGGASDASWVYVDARLLAISDLPGDTVFLRRASTPFLLIASHGTGSSVSFVWTSSALQPLSSPLPVLAPAPSLLLSMTAPSSLLDPFSSLLPDATRATLDGMARAAVREALGEEVSARYDLLPLLRGTTTLALGRSGATLRFLLSSATEGRNLTTELTTLREHVRAGMATGIVRDRSLTQGFRSVTIADIPATREIAEERNSWSLRSLPQPGTGMTLITAVSSRRLLLSNDERWLRQAMENSATQAAHTGPQERVVAAGVAERDATRAFLRDTLGFSLPSSVLDTFGPSGKRLLWSLSVSGDVMTWTVEETN